MIRKIVFLFIILAVIVSGCAKKQTEEITKTDEQVVIIEEDPVDELQIIQEELIIDETKATTPVESVYKVQIFATFDEKKANDVASQVRNKFTNEVYVEYMAPYYKVRVGRYNSREAAEKIRDMARNMGYSDAFIVLP